MTIVFGIDPGSVYTGFGVVCLQGRTLKHVDSGRICAGRSGCRLSSTLAKIYRDLSALLTEHRPDYIAIESVFSQVNVASALKLGQARGWRYWLVYNTVLDQFQNTRLVQLRNRSQGYGGSEKRR